MSVLTVHPTLRRDRWRYRLIDSKSTILDFKIRVKNDYSIQSPSSFYLVYFASFKLYPYPGPDSEDFEISFPVPCPGRSCFPFLYSVFGSCMNRSYLFCSFWRCSTDFTSRISKLSISLFYQKNESIRRDIFSTEMFSTKNDFDEKYFRRIGLFLRIYCGRMRWTFGHLLAVNKHPYINLLCFTWFYECFDIIND